MIKLKIEHKLLEQLPKALSERQVGEVCHDAAKEVAADVKANFQKIGRGKRYWEAAVRSVSVPEMRESRRAEVVITQKGVRLHWKGGTVRATGRVSAVTGRPTKRLLIPFADSPLRKKGVTLAELKLPPEEVHVITSRNGCPLLVHGKRLKTRTNLTWLGKLVPQAEFEPRAEVLPPEEHLRRAVVRGALTRVRKIYEKKQAK